MIAGMAQGYSISSLGEIFQELLCRLSIYSNMLNILSFSSISKYLQSMALSSQVNCKAIDSADLSHVHSGITDYWGVKTSGQLGHMS